MTRSKLLLITTSLFALMAAAVAFAADITGTNGPDRIVGTTSKDNINALGGNDLVLGLAANDTIDGGEGSDLIYGDGVCPAGATDPSYCSRGGHRQRHDPRRSRQRLRQR